MGKRNLDRQGHVRALRALAGQHGVERVSDNACYEKVKAMADAVLAAPGLSEEVKAAAQEVLDLYDCTWPQPEAQQAEPEGQQPPAQDLDAQDKGKPKEWKFSAVQLTYNRTTGEWATKDAAATKPLFDYAVLFAQELGTSLHAEGITVKMEECKTEHVRMRLYFHLQEPFHRQGRDALQPFVFEGIKPNVRPNTASGKTFKGAVNRGHGYLVGGSKAWLCAHLDFVSPFRCLWREVGGWTAS